MYPPGHVLHEMMHADPYPATPTIVDPVSGQRVTDPSYTLTDRIAALAALDIDEAEDLLLATMQQFVLAKTPVDTVCQRMNITPAIYRRLKQKLDKKVRDVVKGKDPYDFIAPIFAELEEAKAVAWREIAMAKPGEWSRRLSSVASILKATSEIGKLLQVGGAFDNSPMRAPLALDEEDAGGANALKMLAQSFLTGGYADKRIIIDGDS